MGGSATVYVAGNIGDSTTASTITLDDGDDADTDDDGIDEDGGAATLILDGTTAQTVMGNIDGANGGEGTVKVDNTSATTTFNGNVGSTNGIGALELNSASTTVINGALKAVNLGGGEDADAAADANSLNTGGILTLAGGDATAGADESGDSISAGNAATAGTSSSSTVIGDVNLATLNVNGGHAAAGGVGTDTDSGTVFYGTSKEGKNVSIDMSSNAAFVNIGTLNITGGNATDSISDSVAGAAGGAADASIAAAQVTGNIVLNNGTSFSQDFNSDGDTEDTNESFAGGSATVTFYGGAAQTVTGTITTDTSGQGAIEVNNNASVTFNSDIGTFSSASTTPVEVGSLTSNDDALTFKGNLGVTVADLGASDLTFSGTEEQHVVVVDNDSTTGTDGLVTTGAITIANETGVNMFNSVSADSTTIDADAKLTFAKSSAVTAETYNVAGNVTVNGTGTLELAKGIVVASGSTVTFNHGSKLALTGEVDGNGDDVAIAGNIAVAAASSAVDIETKAMRAGTVALGTAGTGSNITVTDTASAQLNILDSNLVDFVLSQDADTNVISLVGTEKSAAEVASSMGLTSAQAGSVIAAVAGNVSSSNLSDATDLAILETIENATTGTAAEIEANNALADQLAVQEETMSSAVQGAQTVNTSSLAITNARLASLRTGENYDLAASNSATGFATGDGAMNRNVWGKLFHSKGSQDGSATAAGFDSDTTGMMGGFDHSFADGLVAGVALTYAQSNVDGEGDGESTSDIGTLQLTVYGSKTMADFFVDWQVAYGRGTVDSGSVLDLSTGQSTSTSEYGTDTYSFQVGAGSTIMQDGGGSLTPYANVNFTQVKSEDYTLDYDGTVADQDISPDDVDSLTLTTGMKWDYQMELENGLMFKPQVRGALYYDFIGDSADATALYNASGTTVSIVGDDPEQLGATFGTGLNWEKDTVTFGVSLDADAQSDYTGYTGALNMKVLF